MSQKHSTLLHHLLVALMMDGKLRSLGNNLNVNVSQYGNENTNFFPEMLRFVQFLWLKRRVFPLLRFFSGRFFSGLRSDSILFELSLNSVLVYLPYI